MALIFSKKDADVCLFSKVLYEFEGLHVSPQKTLDERRFVVQDQKLKILQGPVSKTGKFPRVKN